MQRQARGHAGRPDGLVPIFLLVSPDAERVSRELAEN
jgi:hypothetical protein